MNRRRSGIGSGLGALLPSEAQQGGVREVAISSIRQNSRQPRTSFDEVALDELAASIREHGIIQPLIVSERAEGNYELVAGERRWRAAQRAGIEQVPVIVRETTPQQLLELALIENVQRADLNALEEAHAYQSLKDEFGLSDSQIAQRVGKNNRVTVTNTRRLLKLPQQAQDAILTKSITAGHGRALLKFETPEQQQEALTAIVADDLSVREAELFGDLAKDFDGDIDRALSAIRAKRAGRVSSDKPVVAAQPAPPQPPAAQSATQTPPTPALSDDDREVTREMERILGTPVSMSRNDKAVRVTITFHTDEKLQEFFDMLNGA
jgi:ParB family transcriptional regulator, chromosome partitioning protein